MKSGERFTRQKSIKSFTAETNVFDIESDDANIRRVFETLNTALDDKYNAVVNDLENNGRLTEETDAYLIQFTANLICRSDFWREWTWGMLHHDNRPNVVKVILWYYFKDKISFEELEKEPLFRLLADGNPEAVINRFLMFFTGHLLLRLQHYEIVILQTSDERPWFSSTNPVVLENRVGKFEILEKESEIYFPLSPKYLAYMHCQLSSDKANPLRTYEANMVHHATKEQSEEIMKKIMDNAFNEYVLFSDHFEYRHETNDTVDKSV